VDAVTVGPLKHHDGVAEVLVVRLRVVERERRTCDADTGLEPPKDPQVGVPAVCEVVEELPGRGVKALLLQGNRRITKARGKLQVIDAAIVDDTIRVDAPDVPLPREPALESAERLLEQAVAVGPEYRRPHLTGRGATLPGNSFLCSTPDSGPD